MQCYLHQATYDPFHKTGKKHLKPHIKPKKESDSQENPKQKKTKLEAAHYLSSNYTTRLR